MDVEKFLFIFLIILLLAANYSFLDEKLTGFLTEDNSQKIHVDRIIDGDTIESDGTSVRLLGINTPERGEKYYLEAKGFLEDLIFNETVNLEFGKDREDQYGRMLAYVFYKGENVNQKQIENGFANYYFLGTDKHYPPFKESWEKCVSKNLNLCEKSKDNCSSCIFLREINVKSQEAIFNNQCSFSCDLTKWEIKDEGRKKFVFPNFKADANSEFSVIVGNRTDTKQTLFWERKDYVWTKGGDTLFLRDSNGKLVLWEDTREQ
ncbi:MAG: thermonuclease family protein [Nanoarchaeota archaeon]